MCPPPSKSSKKDDFSHSPPSAFTPPGSPRLYSTSIHSASLFPDHPHPPPHAPALSQSPFFSPPPPPSFYLWPTSPPPPPPLCISFHQYPYIFHPPICTSRPGPPQISQHRRSPPMCCSISCWSFLPPHTFASPFTFLVFLV